MLMVDTVLGICYVEYGMRMYMYVICVRVCVCVCMFVLTEYPCKHLFIYSQVQSTY